jgi:hypothetical protein
MVLKVILEKLKVHRDKGLDSNDQQDLQQRRTAYGKNEIPPKPISFLQLPSYVFTPIITSFLLINSSSLKMFFLLIHYFTLITDKNLNFSFCVVRRSDERYKSEKT